MTTLACAVNVAGTFIRHFVTKGYERGVKSMPELLPILRTSTTCTVRPDPRDLCTVELCGC